MVLVSQTELVAGARAGKAVSFPTDTVPALAISPPFARRIYELKQRPANKPLILMGASVEDLLPYLKYTPGELETWQQLMQEYWPGALTLVLPASDLVTSTINPTQTNTVGIRVPDSDLACQILKQTGVLATTSANISGTAALTSMTAIAETFKDVLVLNQTNNRGSGLPSTVVSWQEKQWQILRQGSVKLDRN